MACIFFEVLLYFCAMLRKTRLTPVLFFLLLLLSGCYYSYPNKNDHWTAASPEAVDSVNFYISHHYWTGYNFKAVDSMELLTAPSLAGLPDYGAMPDDTLIVKRHDELVVARVMYVPSDSVDSVWVKVARDQLTQGWIRERTLLAGATPNDPISKFIYHFSGTRTVWAFSLLGLALVFWLVRRMRHKPEHMVHFHDIPSFYPTLLCLCVSCSAVLYGSIQKFVPSTWVEFYYHPTINPFNTQLPAIMALFIASVWAILIVAVAVCDELRQQNDIGGGISYFASLSSVCVVLYLVFTLTTPLYIGYVLLIAYFIFAIRQYRRNKASHIVCGMCGHAIGSLGLCPHCGSMNE